MPSFFLLVQVYQNEAAWCSSNYPFFQMTKGPQHVFAILPNIFWKWNILSQIFPVFEKKKNCEKKKRVFLIKKIAENCHNCLQYNTKRVLKIVLLSYFFEYPTTTTTLAALTLNYIIFRNVENFSNKFLQINKKKLKEKIEIFKNIIFVKMNFKI